MADLLLVQNFNAILQLSDELLYTESMHSYNKKNVFRKLPSQTVKGEIKCTHV